MMNHVKDAASFLFQQKTAYEMRISDWRSDVCSSDLPARSGMNENAGTRPHCSSVESCSGGKHGYRKRCGLDHADVGRLACKVPRVRGYIICIAPNHSHCALHFVANGQGRYTLANFFNSPGKFIAKNRREGDRKRVV